MSPSSDSNCLPHIMCISVVIKINSPTTPPRHFPEPKPICNHTPNPRSTTTAAAATATTKTPQTTKYCHCCCYGTGGVDGNGDDEFQCLYQQQWGGHFRCQCRRGESEPESESESGSAPTPAPQREETALLVKFSKQATDLQTGTQVAVKLERARMRQSQLISEYNLYKKLSPAEGIPSVFWCGTEGEYQIMAMELLGPSLDDLHQYCNNIFSLKTVLMIGLQMIDRLSYVHSKGWVHRDLKPQNFLMGCGQTANIVHIIDLGLAKQYRDPITQQHIPRNKGLSMTGTARYASINTHLGFEQSRRDDLEALGYMLVYFLKGRLPWMGMQANTRHSKESLILDHKLTTPPDILCSGLPGEFATYLKYCGGLQFSQDPDYAYLKKLLQDLFVKCNYTSDNMYDWTLKKVKQHEEWLADIGAVFCAHID
ncbi:serine/threonine kinase [Pelomyxa schiedti]|nr:serine/threonine kinase [Pelomyxa schiedti]